VVNLLEQAKTELQAGGSAFPFGLPSGFTGFNTPGAFLTFNRALLARVEVYRANYAGALTALSESFINPSLPLQLGVYMNYGTGAGDLANPLSIDPQAGENFGHPSLETGAQLQVDGVTRDQRFVDKIVKRAPLTNNGLTSDLGWIRYPSPGDGVPIIKNEELILLRAEANIGLSNFGAALTDINLVRQESGNLPPLADLGTPDAAITELLYNRLYSMMFEGGYRWIDARRYGRLSTLPVDRPDDLVFSTLPIPSDETNPREVQ
jgi:starch-binding outer membrane protein, SusD/RagB family